MGCVNSKEKPKKVAKENEKELSLSSLFSVSISELPYIEPIKTKEQKRIEYIQDVFNQEFKKQNKKY